MGKFVIRRLAQAVLVVIAATFLLFIGLFVSGTRSPRPATRWCPPETQAILREKFGMDRSAADAVPDLPGQPVHR